MDSTQITNLFKANFDFAIRSKYHLLQETNIDGVSFVERFDSRSADYYVRKIEENKLIELSKNQAQIIRADSSSNYRQEWNTGSIPTSPTTPPPSRQPRFHIPTWLASLILFLIVGTIALLCIRPWMIKVPSVISKEVMEAEYLLAETDLNMVITSGRYYDSEIDGTNIIPQNSILSQAPTAGNSLNKNSDVWVEVSKGKKQVYMPDVTGMLVESTEQALENADADDLSVEIKYEHSDRDMVGTVITQSIGMDEASDFDGKLTLTVSLGPEMLPNQEHSVVLEDYTGMQFEDVKSELIKSGVYLVKSAAVYSSEYQYGEIITQSPAKEEIVKSGDAVYVITSLGTEKARVPDVQYLEVEEAKEKLLSAGLLYEIHYVINPNVKLDHVVTQSIISGRLTTFNTKIVLEVSATSEYMEEIKVADISFVAEGLTLSVGDSVKLQILYSGNEKVRFSSSNSHILSTDSDGNITAHSFGTATIIAYTNEGIAVCTVFVNDESRITSIKEVRLKIGEVVSLASSLPESIRDTVVWRSTNPNIVSVDSNGEVTANNIGFSQVFASYKNQTISCDVVVELEYIELSKEAMKQLSGAESLLKAKNVSYEIEQVYSQTLPKDSVISVIYSGYSDNEYYYVSNGTNVTLKISLGKAAVEKIEIKTKPSKLSYYTGEAIDTTGLSLKVTYTDGTSQTIYNGFKAEADLSTTGEKTVTVIYSNKRATFKVSVEDKIIAVESIRVSPETLSLVLGESKKLSFYITPGNATDQSITLKSSDSSVVQVSGFTVTAAKVGTATVTASSANGNTSVCQITVTAPAVSSVSISEKSLSMTVGDTCTLTAKVYPNDAKDKTTVWKSSNTNIVTVNSSGKVTALSAGTAKITVSAGSKTGTCTITVKAPVSYTMKLSEYNKNLNIGEKSTLSAWVEPKMPLPADGTDRAIVYRSSNTKVATVSSTGEITAVAVGSAEILVETDGVKSAVCTVNVTGKAELTLVKKPTKTTYYLGDSIDTNGLKLGYTDMYGKYTEITNGYTVSGYDLHRIGTQTVKVQYAGLMITFDLTVKTPSITINKLQIKDNLLLTVQTEPEAQEFDIWSSDSEVFLVTSYLGATYVAQPTGEGTAYAYASMVYNGVEYSDYVSITVERIVENYSFEIRYTPNDGISLYTIKTDIPNFDANGVKWSCTADCDTKVEKDTYVVYDLYDFDFYTVTAYYYYNGIPFEATYTYRYTDTNLNADIDEIEVMSITIDNGLRSASHGGYNNSTGVVTQAIPQFIKTGEANYAGKLTAILYPENAANKTITWSSSDNTIATVTSNGEVYVYKAGTFTITATASNGVKASVTQTYTTNNCFIYINLG